jgi:hypothetical protein
VLIGWFLRLSLVLAIVALIGFNGFTLAEAHVDTSDDAHNCAAAAASSYQQNQSLSEAFSAAAAATGSAEESVVAGSLRVEPGGQIRLELRRRLHTVLMAGVPGLRRFTVLTVSAQAGPETLP